MYDVTDISLDLDSYRNKSYLTHNFHPYPAKYVPQIPSEIISRLSQEGDWILDPFCGSGTTLVESRLLNRNSSGVDVNPLACLASRVKTTVLSQDEVDTVESTVDDIFSDIFKGVEYPVPNFPNVDHWFEKFVQSELATVQKHISEIENENPRNFLWLALSAIIVKVSNQESDTRYKAIRKDLQVGSVGKHFQSKVFNMLQRMAEFSSVTTSTVAQVFHEDSTSFAVKPNSYDLAVTSPPYLNSYDYYLYHKHRMLWLSLDYRYAQDKEFGSRNKHNDKGLGLDDYRRSISDSAIRVLAALKPGKYYCLVVGDAILRDMPIKMNQVFDSVLTSIGFEKAHEIAFAQRKYTRSFTPNLRSSFKESYVLIYKKPTNGGNADCHN